MYIVFSSEITSKIRHDGGMIVRIDIYQRYVPPPYSLVPGAGGERNNDDTTIILDNKKRMMVGRAPTSE